MVIKEFNLAMEQLRRERDILHNLERVHERNFVSVKRVIQSYEDRLSFFNGKTLTPPQIAKLNDFKAHKYTTSVNEALEQLKCNTATFGKQKHRVATKTIDKSSEQSINTKASGKRVVDLSVTNASSKNLEVSSTSHASNSNRTQVPNGANSGQVNNIRSNDSSVGALGGGLLEEVMCTPPNVSDSLFLSILLDWKFQVFCSALLLAGTGGVAITAFGIGSLVIPAAVDTGLKLAAALGAAGLFSSVVSYLSKPNHPKNPSRVGNDLNKIPVVTASSNLDDGSNVTVTTKL